MNRVLVVDNSATGIAKITRILGGLGYSVAGSAASGAEAIMKAKQLLPDIVLMNAMIPGEIDGIQAAQIIEEGFHMPVLPIVDYADEQSVYRLKQANLNAWCSKPIKKGELKAGIEKVLEIWEKKRDITKLYEELVENTNDLIHVQDGSGNITFINRTAFETLGYAYEQIVGKNIRDFVTPETYRLLGDVFKRQLQGEGANTFEMQVYDRQGNIRTLETRERLIWEGDRIIEVQGISRDITQRKHIETEFARLNRLKEQLLGSYGLSDKLRLITEGIVEIFNADFARIWILKPGDLCEKGCYHASVSEGPHKCRNRSCCLHLMESSGRYTHTDGKIHRRVPFGCYKIGKIASGIERKFLTNDAPSDPLVHDRAWVESLGLVSFAGYRLLSADNEPVGVLALFSGQSISPQEDALLEDLANTTARIIQSSRTEEILRQSEERYRALFENAAFGIFHALPEGRLLRVNTAMTRMLGYDSSEEMIASIGDIAQDIYVEPENRARIVAEIIQKDGWGTFEERFRRKDGAVIFVRLHMRPVHGPNNAFEYLEGFVEDVTERKQAQEVISRDQELKEKILQTAAVAIAFARHRKLTWGNAAMAQTFGFTDESQYVGKDTSILYASQEEYQRIGKLLYEGTGTGGIIETVVRFKRTDSTEFLGLLRASFVCPDDPLKEVVVSFLDITEKARAEEALSESERRYRLLAENADDIIFTMDASLRFTYISPSVTRVRGFCVEEAMSQTLEEALAPDSLAVAMKAFTGAIEAEDSGPDDHIHMQRLELEETCKDGSTVWTETTFTVLRDENGNYTGLLGITRDIGKRKQFENALEQSEEKYRVVVENAYEGIAVIKDGVFVFANKTLLDFFNYTEGEFIGKPFTDVIVPDDYGEAESEYRRKIAGDEYSYVSAIRAVTRTGEIISTEVNGVQIVWGGAPALLIFVRDVTDRKKIEQALIQSEAKYRDLIENAIDLIFTVDTEGNFLEVNESLLRQTGYSKQDIISAGFRNFVHPEDMGVAIAAYERGRQGQHYEFEIRSNKKDGTYEWYSFVIRPIIDINGNVEYVHCVARNISDRKAAEEALSESEEKFRGMFETSRDFMFISALDGTVLGYNPSAKNFFGYSEEEIKKFNMIDIYANPDERDAVLGILMEKGFVENYEIGLKRKDGSIVDALVTATVRRDGQGNIIGIQGTARDVTQIKRMERQLLQAEKLSGLGTMISGVAHEINNPLTAIMGNAELMLTNDSISDKDKKSLEVILKESERAAKIVSGLLTFAREHVPERRMINVNDSIMEAYKLREYSLRVSNINTELRLADHLPPTFADPYHLQQVFANIINNARDSLMENGGGTLTIRTLRNDTSLFIEFEDDGPGIEAENMKKIFNPFFTTKDIGKGTGLGLSVAYGIIEEHNGKIGVDSQPGRGATFTIELPIVNGTEDRVVKDTKAAGTVAKGKSVLIVDDEKDILEFLSRVLKQNNYSVQTALTAEEAIALINRQTFDAVVADIKMPGMGGKQLHGYIQKNMPDVTRKIVFITGDILSDETQAFLKATGNRCIEKPFKLSQFISIINELISE